MTADRKYVPTKLTPETLGTLLAIRGELPAKIFFLLADLGGHLESGWPGSIATLASVFNKRSGRHVGREPVGDAVDKLVAAGLLLVVGNESGRRRFCLGCPETGQGGDRKPVRGVTGNRSGGCPETGQVADRKAVTPITLEKKERGRERQESAQAPARDECLSVPARPLRRDEAIHYKADGLAADLTAVGLRLSQRQLELLVGECGSDEVRRQLAAWPRRETAWAKRPASLFAKYCREGEPVPVNGDGVPKPLLSLDAVSVLRAELRDRRISKGAVVRALAAVGAADLDHLTAETRRTLLAALGAS